MKFVPWKGIEIPESAKFLPMKFGILGFGIQSTAQEIGIWNPGASDKEPGIHSWNLDSRMQDSLRFPYMRHSGFTLNLIYLNYVCRTDANS